MMQPASAPSISSSSPSWRRSFDAPLLLGALLIRLLYLATILDNPFFLHPVTDEAMYDIWAQALVAGEPFLDASPYYDSPLPAYFLAIVYGLFGHSDLWGHSKLPTYRKGHLFLGRLFLDLVWF